MLFDNYQNSDHLIHILVIRNYIGMVKYAKKKEQKINIASQMIEYLSQYTNWVSSHNRFKSLVINKTREFITYCQEDQQFVELCNMLLSSLGQP